MNVRTPLNLFVIFSVLLGVVHTAQAFDPKNIVLKDPSGDDNGPGTFKYPTKSDYTKGSFDMTELTITDKGKNLEFKVTFRAKIKDPWKSKSWGGNGFSLQMVQVYIDTKKGGNRSALPGINVKFPKGQAPDKVVFISPQPKAKIISEVKAKKKKMLKRLVVPIKTYAQGNQIVAVVKKSDLGKPNKRWGFQAIVQSNEGYPSANSVLARKVNEYEGEHRFGGGNDYDCDPHAIDILAGKAKGAASEKAAQHKALKAFTCDAAGKGTMAVVPMVYPGK